MKIEEEERKAADKKARGRKTGLSQLAEKEEYKQNELKNEMSVYEKIINHEVLNAPHPDVDYESGNLDIDKEAMQRAINMVIIGNVDSGKSTLCGQLLV
jgi:polynucleotide 5'-kinase involved in rRNA processing